MRRLQTKNEEIANALTHGLGVLGAVTGLVLLVVFASLRGNAWSITGLSIFGAALTLLYLTSTLYHAIPVGRAKRVFRLLDHSMIFILIAGTYTPVTLTVLRGAWGWTLFGLAWGIALIGVIVELSLGGRHGWVRVVLYVLMGWMVVLAFRPMMDMVPPGFFFWLLAGGLAYTVGIVFYAFKRMPYHHAVWHLFVVAGSTAHVCGMFLYIVPGGA